MDSADHALSVEELNHFNEHGYVIVEDLYDCSVMQSLKKHAIDLCLDVNTPATHIKWNALVQAGIVKRTGAAGLHSLFRPQIISQRFRNLCRDPKLTNRLASILGPDLMTFNGLVIFKAKEIGLPFPYHQDMWYFSRSHQISQSCAIWLALDDADEENGCLWVVPDSHRLDILEHVQPEADHVQQEFREVRSAWDMKEISVPLRSGSCLFFDGKLLHRSAPNTSSRDRACYVIHNTSADTRFSQGSDLERRAVMPIRGKREPQFLS